MTTVIVLGAQWGDEGKGKITDYLAEQADMVVRCQGGSNAGHTVVSQGATYKLHLIPSGILYPDVECIIGNGVVVDIGLLLDELDELKGQGLNTSNLKISNRAHLIMPYHKALDQLQEEQKGKAKIGTTGRGIGPAYVDKVNRSGIRIADLLDWAVFQEKLKIQLAEKNHLFASYGKETFGEAAILKEYESYVERVKPFVADTAPIINDRIDAGKKVLFEGAQGTLLDIDHGTYPFVTSSHPTSGGACTGSGVGPTKINRIVGIAKAYATRVGSGPFPSELLDEMGEKIRQKGGEFGVTTGRPRRCGWFDALVARYSVMVNGLTDLAITKLDILDELPEIKICRAYSCQGKELTEMPADLNQLAQCEPIYETMPGWQQDTTGARTFADLPQAAQNYIKRLEELSKAPVSIVAVGPDRKQTILRNPIY